MPNRDPPLFKYPAVGASLIAIGFFLVILFSANLFSQGTTPSTLGIATTLGTLTLLTLLVLLLFFIN